MAISALSGASSSCISSNESSVLCRSLGSTFSSYYVRLFAAAILSVEFASLSRFLDASIVASIEAFAPVNLAFVAILELAREPRLSLDLALTDIRVVFLPLVITRVLFVCLSLA